MKTTTLSCLIGRSALVSVSLLILCFGLLPNARAVNPAPDGGYPGGNTAEGQAALLSLTTGGFNTSVGFFSLRSNTTGAFNTAIGAGTLLANTAGENTATGAGALLSNTAGLANTANGAFALFSNTTAGENTANGNRALFSNTTGVVNTANGYAALANNTTGSVNTAIGAAALATNTTGGSNVALGFNAGLNVTTANNVICIGANVSGANVGNTCYIGNIRGVATQNADAVPVLIDSAGQLGTMSSSRRFKKEIEPMGKTSESLLALKPVTFHYKSDIKDAMQFGLIAEDVAAVNPDLVVRDEKGEIYTVRYDAVNAMLLNEFLKEHHKVEEQDAGITQLKFTVTKQEAAIAQQRKDFEAQTAQQEKEIKALIATVKEQAAQIQKVSAQLEVRKSSPQTVLNDQ